MMTIKPWEHSPKNTGEKKPAELVTNLDFIQEIFKDKPDHVRIVATGFSASPGAARSEWASRPVFSGLPAQVQKKHNNYYAPSTVNAGADGTYNRIDSNFEACYLIPLDDIGINGKVPESAINLDPSYTIETSPDNCQWGFILRVPCSDKALLIRLFNELKNRNLTDKNGVNVVRWIRLPVGINNKSEVVDLHGEPFETKLLSWNPEIKYTIQELVDGLGLNGVLNASKKSEGGNMPGGVFVAGTPVFDVSKASQDIMTGDNFHDQIRDKAAHLIGKGIEPEEVIRIIQNEMQLSSAAKDARWKTRFDDIPRAVQSALKKGYSPEVQPVKREIVEPGENTKIERKLSIPKHLLTIPGHLNEFIDFYKASAVTMQPHLAVQAALALGSVACGRYYKTDRKVNFSNLWFLNVAKSGAGKEQGKWCIEEVLTAAGAHDLISEGYTSKGGLFSALDEAPAHISIIDELGRYLDAGVNNRGSQHFKDGITALMETWGRSHGTMRPPKYSTKGLRNDQKEALKRPVIKPCVSLLGMTTPGTLFDSIDESSVNDGFLARWIMAFSDIEANGELLEDEYIDPPSSLVAWVEAALQRQSGGNLPPIIDPTLQPVTRAVHIDKHAWELFSAFKHEEKDLAKKSDVPELLQRMAQKSLRIALILSVSVDPIDPVITPDLAQWAIDYARYCDTTLARIAQEQITAGRLGQLIKRVYEYICKGKNKGKTMRDLKRAYGGHGRDLDDALKTLMASEQIDCVEIDTLKGPKRNAWIAEKWLK